MADIDNNSDDECEIIWHWRLFVGLIFEWYRASHRYRQIPDEKKQTKKKQDQNKGGKEEKNANKQIAMRMIRADV